MNTNDRDWNSLVTFLVSNKTNLKHLLLEYFEDLVTKLFPFSLIYTIWPKMTIEVNGNQNGLFTNILL